MRLSLWKTLVTSFFAMFTNLWGVNGEFQSSARCVMTCQAQSISAADTDRLK
jgi:hypothetical protein